MKTYLLFFFFLGMYTPVMSQTPDTNLILRLDFLLDSLREEHEIRGISAHIVFPDRTSWQGTSGESHPGEEITPGMIFGIGSNTKLFTSVVILKLIEEGKLNLDDSIYHWLPSNPNIRPEITIRQLLNHTSGLHSYNNIPAYRDSILNDPDRVFNPRELVNWIGSPLYEPGMGWNYSNSNYLLAGIIAEEITGKDLGTLFTENIYSPLDLGSLSFISYPETATLAHPWDGNRNNYGLSRVSLHSAAWAAGGMYGNAADMGRWYHSLFREGFVSDATISEMTRFTGPQSHGLGIREYMFDGRPMWGHGGGIMGGYISLALYSPEEGFSLSILTNGLSSPVLLVAQEIVKELFAFMAPDIGRGLVAHWSFDNDTVGLVLDEGPLGLHGKAYNIDYADGVTGKAAVFKHSQSSIFFPDKNMLPPDTIAGLQHGSISVWFKYINLGGQILPILYYGESSTGTPHNSLIIEIGHGRGNNPSNKRLYFTIVNRRFCYDSRVNLLEDTWYHFVAVVSPDGNTGYLNGEEMTDRNYNLGSDASYTDFFHEVPVQKMLSIGYGRYGQEDPFFNFRGSIDEVRIYNRALSADEVKILYQKGEVKDDLSPTHPNVSYGPYERNVLDFWQAEVSSPVPLVVFIHGGGFAGGNKNSSMTGINLDYLQRCLDNGVSFAAINYRLRHTTRLDTILLDIARAIQFLRYQSVEWNIDKDRIAAYGPSAGGGASLWLAVHEDLADSSHDDPVLRESTRLTVAGHLNSQATYDFLRWFEFLDVAEDWMETMGSNEDLQLYHIPDRSWYDSTEIVELRKKLDMASMIGQGTPPVFLQNLNSPAPPITRPHVVHHPRHAIYLASLFEIKEVDHAIVLAATPLAERVDMLDFFFRYLFEGTGIKVASQEEKKGVRLYPNPALDYLKIEGYEGKVSVFDVMGRLRWEGETKGGMDISTLGKGMYLLKAGNESRMFYVIKP